MSPEAVANLPAEAVTAQSGEVLKPARKWPKILAVFFLLLIALEVVQLLSERTTFTSSLAHLMFSDNLHAVREGRFYRSGEMSPDRLTEVMKEKGIKTVIDLRLGGDDDSEVSEASVVEANGGQYVHFPVRGSREMSRRRIAKLIKVLDRSQEPILVHCSSGTHRSGVVASLWLLTRGRATLEEAKAQLKASFGFFQFERDLKGWFQGHPTVDHTLWKYEEEQKKSGKSVRQWVAGHR